MRIGLYGGSFDPIHAGHVAPVVAARERLGLDSVIYLPTASPPHKSGREFATAHQRFAMVELALLDHEALRVSTFELVPERPAYTVDTVRHFRSRHPEDQLFLLLGADSLARLDTYRHWEEIVDQVQLAVLGRPGWDLDRVLAERPRRLREMATAGDLRVVDNPPIESSSTRLREILGAGGDPPPGWMNERVLQYARKYCLYR